ncbi:MAG: D-alanyl-D-alanine carboxypeptidase/D-alanyl-D-alanine-endopeptidase [Thermoleophilaceae bacterium]|nr:D-alanyl-D-alanine carboxypeptidase/D-alanyl-D-alanine-endopeptidase [Thermoleophilaceae bacterium]
MRRLLPLAALLACLLAPAAAAQAQEAKLRAALASAMRIAGSRSGAYVLDATTGEVLFSRRAGTPRILASNTKLFTTSATLAAYGEDATLATTVVGVGEALPDGTWPGDLYLVGGGDPTFGSESFVRRNYGSGGTVEDLAAAIEAAGITSVRGRIYGDESRFDSLRGGPASGFRVSIDVGPLSALAFNRGLAPSGFQANPPAFAADQLRRALERRGIDVRGSSRAGVAPAEAHPIATEESPPMARLVRLTNKPSDNFFAETLLKDLASRKGARGTTAAGARAARSFARTLGLSARLVDGSGLSRADRASPRAVVGLLDRMRSRPEFDALYDSLPIAGRDGTLRDRMRRGAARGRCRAKTGTLHDVSALSGFCSARGGDLVVFSFLMNRTRVYAARAAQDRMANALAAYRGRRATGTSSRGG